MEIRKKPEIQKITLPPLSSSSAEQQLFWLQTFGENQRSVVSFFGPKVEPSSLLPRPKNRHPGCPRQETNQKTR